MGIDESLVQEIVRRILTEAAPDKIILFGSAATGGMTRDSDIDLLIVERDPGDQRKKSEWLRKTLCGLGYLFDVIVISTEWFEESKGVIGGIGYPANKYGKVIYEAARGNETQTYPTVARQGRARPQGRIITPFARAAAPLSFMLPPQASREEIPQGASYLAPDRVPEDTCHRATPRPGEKYGIQNRVEPQRCRGAYYQH